MNVLFISNDPTIFDTKTSAHLRMRAYAHEIGVLHFLSPGKGPRTQKIELPEGGTLYLHAVNLLKPLAFPIMVSRAQKIIHAGRIEIVSAQDPFEYGWVATCAVKGTNARLHIQLHTDVFSPWFLKGSSTKIFHISIPFINSIRQWLADKSLPVAHGIRVVSKRIQDSLVVRYHTTLSPISIIPIPLPTILPPAAILPPHFFTFTFITMGRLEPEKRIEDSIYALSLIHKKYPQAGLIVLGEGGERERLEKLAKKRGIQESVMFLGYRSDALALIQNADAYIQASAYEGYSRTLLEAALARLPIITTDVGIVGEVFICNQAVLCAEPGDPATLALHMNEFIENSPARAEYLFNAEQAAHQYLVSINTSPAAIAQDLRNVLTRSHTKT